ncbi:MAG TPA: PD-(D/E)XK nuclease family protein [Actinomycetota bacterium]|nr:PD-(D/E)XK nuclease family protein [Actinomycetota bacterium]
MDLPLLKLSPSSATDFKNCPQLFKFRAIDRLPEPISGAAAKGSLVHAVLERLFSEPPVNRTPERAWALLDALWAEVGTDAEFRPTDMDQDDETRWISQARTLLSNYFKLEDPRALTASRLEWWVEYELPEIHLRGIIDRVEERPDGSWILTDYKTGRVPGESRELASFFGLRFYALVCWRAFGVMPAEIRLVYLADPAVLTLDPDERMLVAFERQMMALGAAIKKASDTGDWRARPSPFCMSCSFQPVCPAWAQLAPEQGHAPGEAAAG